MSVIGLTRVLTHKLTRTRSFQVCDESTTSRGADGLVLHSGSYSTQNSTQPIGARVAAPSEMKSGRLSALPAFAVASEASAMKPAAAPRMQNSLTPQLM